MCNISYAANNVPYGDVGEYGNWITTENIEKYNDALSENAIDFQKDFQTSLSSSDFVPIEAKLGFSFMKALSSIDYVLQISLVRFTIIFLFLMYAFWIMLEAYKMSTEASDYKAVLYKVFEKGIFIVIWVVILNYGPAKIFTTIMDPIMQLGTFLSDFILDSVAQAYNVTMPDTCGAIHKYVNANTPVASDGTVGLLVSPDSAANIMCLPARISVYFYHATGTAWHWMIDGFKIGHSATEIVVGAVCIVIFIKCVFKYAFMTLGVVADLFMTLLMLPFTAVAEAMPSTTEKNYAGQIFSGILKIFSAKKLSDVIGTFVNVTIYFVSLAIVIAICAALLTNVIPLSNSNIYTTGSAMVTILCGGLILYLAGQADKLAKKIGGEIDNSFGQKLINETKILWTDTKNVAEKIFKDKMKK